MSGLDPAARGLAADALDAAAGNARVLMAASKSGPIYGAPGAGFVSTHQVELPADTIVAGAMLRFRMVLAKYQPFNAGHAWRLLFAQNGNEVVFAQNAVGASMGTADVDQHVFVAPDRKSLFGFSENALDIASLDAVGMFASTGVMQGAVSTLGARAPSGLAMFVANSPPPTVQTVMIDFAQPVTVRLDVYAVNGDVVEVLGASLEMLAMGDEAVNLSPSTATAWWGDSLTEGTGASAINGVPMDVVAQLRRLRPGWPITAEGLGGQKSQAIVDRITTDPIRGRQWKAVIWTGTNDFDDHVGDGAGWLVQVRAQIDRALAYRTSSETIICNLHPRAGWAVGDANYVALQELNAGLSALYGERVCDLFSALATDNGKVPAASMVDDVHLSDAGYTTVSQAVDARMTALGWH